MLRLLNEPLLCKHRHGLWDSSQKMSASAHGPCLYLPVQTLGTFYQSPKWLGWCNSYSQKIQCHSIKDAVEIWLASETGALCFNSYSQGLRFFLGWMRGVCPSQDCDEQTSGMSKHLESHWPTVVAHERLHNFMLAIIYVIYSLIRREKLLKIIPKASIFHF